MQDVSVVEVAPRPFAAVRRTVARRDIPTGLIASLDLVWPLVRSRSLRNVGHNIALYRELGGDRVEMDCGVEVEPPFQDAGEVRLIETPAGTAAHAAHAGSPQGLGATYDRIFDWLRAHGSPATGQYWEVYGDVDEHGALLGIDVFVLLPDGFTA